MDGEERYGDQAHGGRWSDWRCLAAAPAMFGGLGVALVATGLAGRWAAAVLLVWLLTGLALLTRQGERVAVRVALGCRRPTSAEHTALNPVWHDVLDRCRVAPDAVDLYVRPGRGVNAYAIGRRTIAVTNGVLREYRAGKLGPELLGALAAHELGHHATRATRFGLAASWYAAPWRMLYRTVARIALRLVGRQPLIPTACVALAAVAIAAGQGARQHSWFAVSVLLATATVAIAAPLTDAALSRASEYAADQYAASAGYGKSLSILLTLLDPRRSAPSRGRGRLLERHPPTRSRIARIDGPAALIGPKSAGLAA